MHIVENRNMSKLLNIYKNVYKFDTNNIKNKNSKII